MKASAESGSSVCQEPKSSAAQVGQVELGHHPATVRGAVDPAVVHADQVAVAGQPDVALQPVGALVDRPQVGAEGVLGQRVRGAAVRDDQRPARPAPHPCDRPTVPVVDFDPAVRRGRAGPVPGLRRLRATTPVAWHDGLGMYLTFGHAEADAVLRDRRLGRLWRLRWPEESLPAYTLLHVHSMLENEPPVHTRLRRLVAAALRARAGGAAAVPDRGRRRRARRRPARRRLPAGPRSTCSRLYAEPLPVAVIAALLGRARTPTAGCSGRGPTRS